MPPPFTAALRFLAQTTTDSSPTTLLIATFSGFGIAGILAALYIIDGRKRDKENAELVRTFLAQLTALLPEMRDVLRDDTEAHHAAAAASKATSEALERYAHLLPTADQLARIAVYLERLDRR